MTIPSVSAKAIHKCCGVLHFAMPIVIESVSLERYLAFISSQISPPNRSFSNGSKGTPSSAGNSNSGSKVSAKKRGNIEVTPEQHEVIVGSLLGDMSATRPPGPKRNTRLSIGQANLPYLLSLADLLASLIRQQNPTPDNKFDRSSGIQYYGYKLCTMSLPCLNFYREWFYPAGVKIVPNDIMDHLTPLGLAHWFMQDGSKTSDNGVIFATHCFSEAELQLLIQTLSTKFGLNCTLQKSGSGNQKVIYVRRASIPTFIKLVCPYIHPSMSYKVPSQ